MLSILRIARSIIFISYSNSLFQIAPVSALQIKCQTISFSLTLILKKKTHLRCWGGVGDHDIAAGKLDVLWVFLLERSILVDVGVRVGEVALEVAAVLVLNHKLCSWLAVAACSQSCLSRSNGGKVCRKSVASDVREIS